VLVRVVILVLVVAIILWLLTARSRARSRKGGAQMPQQPESFARCAHCGVHLPLNDAVIDRGVAYCSEAHRLAGPRDHGGS
jgi:uncharacterized protein